MQHTSTLRTLLPAFLVHVGIVLILLTQPAQGMEASLVLEIPHKGPRQIQEIEQRGLEVIAQTREGKLHVVARPEDVAWLSTWGARPRTIAERFGNDIIAALDADLGDYRTYDETVAVLDSLQTLQPTLVSKFSIGTSIEGRDIWAVKLSDNVASDEDEPEVLIVGNHHARELMSVEIPLQFLEYLVGNYPGDAQVQQLVDNREIYFVPILNVDGYVYIQNNHTGNSSFWWRKNRRNNGNGSFGVDLNRNYAYEWGADDVGSSPFTSSNIYRGTAAFSEPETAALRDFCNSRSFIMELSYHSYGNLLLYPWGYTFGYTTDHAIFQGLAQAMTASNGYLPGNPAEGAIYRTNGGSDDWGYGETISKPSIYSFTPEVGSSADGGFAPPESLIAPYFSLLLPMNLEFLELAGNPMQVLGPIEPQLLSVHATAASELVLNWTDNVPADTNPALSYEIDYRRNPGFQSTIDAETVSPFVELAGGFVSSSNRAAQGTLSYYAGQQDNLSSTLTTTAPFTVTPGNSTFTCQLWYNIETDWDYAYVEVSEDQGLTWIPVAGTNTTNTDPNGNNRGNGLTGNSGGWILANFALDDYIGQIVQLRVHYVTDGAVLEEGLYIDDLGPVPSFSERGTVASGIVGTSHAFVPGPTDTWCYRVRGLDADGDWSSWSNALTVQVDTPTDPVITPPRLSGLGNNFPNPFNPNTLIPYTVGSVRPQQASLVELSIYDVSGHLVRRLVHGRQLPGVYRAQWNGRDDHSSAVPSGTYLARLSVDGVTIRSRKLLLLK